MSAIKNFTVDKLRVEVYENREEMGKAAAAAAVALLKAVIAEKGSARVVFAAAPSQNEFLKALCCADGIQWQRVTAFHMDEYIGLPSDAPQGFGNFLRKRIFDILPFSKVHYLNPCAQNILQECERYSDLLNERAIDIAFMGIGENGHIAFNDPPVADFFDKCTVKAVRLDEICRKQQVNDGCFASLDKVPTHALTLTVPALANAEYQLCMVPGPAKANAVNMTLEEPISTSCPAGILRKCKNAVLYIERDSAGLLKGVKL